MSRTPYPYYKENGSRYKFISSGRRAIEKVVEFTPTRLKNVYNLGFGDLLPNGEMDDTAKSNNGDIIKVFATVISILEDFTETHPSLKIVFWGSTLERTKIYNRIIKTYYQSFSKIFVVSGATDAKGRSEEVIYNPSDTCFYSVFFVKRI